MNYVIDIVVLLISIIILIYSYRLNVSKDDDEEVFEERKLVTLEQKPIKFPTYKDKPKFKDLEDEKANDFYN